MDHLMTGLKVREETCCFPHALEIASAYYKAALPKCDDTLAQVWRLRAENPAEARPPARVQPPRAAKKAPQQPRQPKVKASVERRIESLLAGLPIPLAGTEVMSEGQWLEEVRAAMEEAATRKALEVYRQEPRRPCVFGRRAWRCGMCGEGLWQACPAVEWGGWRRRRR